MKILYKNMGFGGGAPLSLLEYIKIAQKNDLEVVAVGQFTFPPKLYRQNKIRLIDFPCFKLNKPFLNIKLLYLYYKLIQSEQPAIIHTITVDNCIFHKVLSKLLCIPIIYTIPGGKIPGVLPFILKDEPLIVFSEENKKDLIGYGYGPERINVITNRMSFATKHNDIYKEINKEKPLNLLLVSTFFAGKINSVLYVIDLVENYLVNEFDNIKLTIIGDGPLFEIVSRKAREVNKKYSKELIQLLGYQSNVFEFINKSHVVFGKGRSIIEAIGLNRYSIVVNESNQMEICTPETIDYLREFNFSGRKIKNGFNPADLVKLLNNILNKKYDAGMLLRNQQTIKMHYDMKYAESKVMSLYEEAINSAIINNNRNFKFFNLIHCIYMFFKIYLYIVYNYIRSRLRTNTPI